MKLVNHAEQMIEGLPRKKELEAQRETEEHIRLMQTHSKAGRSPMSASPTC
jgi:hypothetical protein